MQSDFSIALDDAFGDGPGVLILSGTGSVAFGRGPTGSDRALRRLGPELRRRGERRVDRAARAQRRLGGGGRA